MYRLAGSIRRHALACARLLCLILFVASTSRCTADSITGGENPAPENPAPENPAPVDPDPVATPLGVGSVTLSPESLTVGVHETAQLSAIVRDTDGAVIADPQVVFTVIGLPDGTVAVDSNGLVTGLAGGCGRGTVVAWSGGVNSNAGVITVGSPSAPGCWDFLSEVGSVTLSPDSLTLAGGTAQLTVIVRDTDGAVIANPQVVFSFRWRREQESLVGLPGIGTVDSTGLVTLYGCNVGTMWIIARSRGVNSNTAVVHNVGFPSSAGCWDY